MFVNEKLNNHLATSSTVKTQSAVIAEWNMNFPDNISKIGNYRYRPTAGTSSIYSFIPNSYDPNDTGKYYTGATDADVVLDGAIDNDNSLILFKSPKDKEKLLYSLEDCFGRFRPRSGINKVRYGVTQYLHQSNSEMAARPRYYMSHKDDKFKYWTSYRTEDGAEVGIANIVRNNQYYINDAAPFVVYENAVPSNRVIIKMQTSVGTVSTGNLNTLSSSIPDPLFGDANSTTPRKWKVQYLENNSWVDAISFEQNDLRSDGSSIVGPDGYVEIAYGLKLPLAYRDIFIDNGSIASLTLLPTQSTNGNAFLVKENANDVGTYYIWLDGGYDSFVPEYGWYLLDAGVTQTTPFVQELSNPLSYTDSANNKTMYREFQYIGGLRVVVDTMNKVGATLDLIELSPRLSADLSGLTTEFSISKPASDLGISGLPVGQLLASTGSISLFDYNQSFNENNANSIVANYLTRNLQFKFFEVISEVDGINYYVPIKTMYAEEFPSISSDTRSVSISLRDMYLYFESVMAPQILIPDVSLSYAVSILLDSIGFSNYAFKRLANETDVVIPYFYVGPDQSIAQVLQSLAISTQSTMFFDEYNNFVVMSKEYMMPGPDDRATDFIISGSSDSTDSGILENETNKSYIANIVGISSQDRNVYNDGQISYTTRYIQKTQASIKQTYLNDRAKTWIYKPSLLWEVTASETTKSQNEQTATAEAYALSAIPLNSTLSNAVPSVVNRQIVNNVLDFGEGIYWLGRYNGYFYANGEIIKYDAVEYSVSGLAENIWITSTQDYKNYFSKIPFNGKMYATGRVRIYAEPNYETVGDLSLIANGPVAKHGRGQFGTPIVSHSAGIDTYWKSNDNVRGCKMESSYLFGTSVFSGTLTNTEAGTKTGAVIHSDKAKKSLRTDLIKNYFSASYASELTRNAASSIESQTVQSSALVFEGPTFETNESPIDFISYIKKDISSDKNLYKHFGTRMRVVGKIESDSKSWQVASGAMSFFNLDLATPEVSNIITGGSGGIAVSLNSETNVGYYYEIAALSAADTKYFGDNEAKNVANVFFYKVQSDSSGKAIPVKLWSGLTTILVDGGNFVGQERVFAQDDQTVYDIAVEYENVGSSRRFYLYLNDTQIATVLDNSPLPEYKGMALFVRGSSKCMFEHVYALSNNYSQNAGTALTAPVAPIFSKDTLAANQSFSKYAISGIIQSTYLSGISSASTPKYNLYFDEFGTIMREASYFNIRYDKAYPALYAKIAPTFNKLRGYTVSGFLAGAYGAEFLVFNAANTTLRLDENTGNYLRIIGITFTQNSQNELTVDEYFDNKSDFSNAPISKDGVINSTFKAKENYQDIKYSRITHGKNEFSLALDYVQNKDAAESLMSWLTEKIMKPKKSVGVRLFANPTLQLGDIVQIDYSTNGIDQVAAYSSRFVVYNIEYNKTTDGPEMSVYLSEV